MSTWKTLLLIYDRISFSYQERGKQRKHFEYTFSPEEIRDGVESFKRFPTLVADLTSGVANIEYEVVHAKEPLTTLTLFRTNEFWPSPDDTRPELGKSPSICGFHSILVYWPQRDLETGDAIPNSAWGLGMGASNWSSNATYATVCNAPTRAWEIPMIGEVWLHEWLHGVCAHFAAQGYKMPKGDADGGDLHGYVRSPTTGWTDFYRDLMTCNVVEGARRLGIPRDAWQQGLSTPD
jgi:hypothetical protein